MFTATQVWNYFNNVVGSFDSGYVREGFETTFL